MIPCRGTTEIGVPSPTTEQFVKAWCDRCVHELTGDVDGLTAWLLPAYNIRAMGLGDYVTYIFTALVVSLTITGEQKDIKLCSYLIETWRDKLPPKARTAMVLLNFLRKWTFLPGMLLCVMLLVAVKGGDALTLCFNTVAMLFMCEIDNAAYYIGLVEAVRVRMDHVGRCHLTERQAADVWYGKAATISMLPWGLLLPLPLIQTGEQKLWIVCLPIPFLTYVMIAVAEAFGPGKEPVAGAGEACKRVGAIFGRWFAGLIGFGIFVGLAAM